MEFRYTQSGAWQTLSPIYSDRDAYEKLNGKWSRVAGANSSAGSLWLTDITDLARLPVSGHSARLLCRRQDNDRSYRDHADDLKKEQSEAQRRPNIRRWSMWRRVCPIRASRRVTESASIDVVCKPVAIKANTSAPKALIPLATLWCIRPPFRDRGAPVRMRLQR